MVFNVVTTIVILSTKKISCNKIFIFYYLFYFQMKDIETIMGEGYGVYTSRVSHGSQGIPSTGP